MTYLGQETVRAGGLPVTVRIVLWTQWELEKLRDREARRRERHYVDDLVEKYALYQPGDGDVLVVFVTRSASGHIRAIGGDCVVEQSDHVIGLDVQGIAHKSDRTTAFGRWSKDQKLAAAYEAIRRVNAIPRRVPLGSSTKLPEHPRTRAAERHGLVLTDEDLRAIQTTIALGYAKPLPQDRYHAHDGITGWIVERAGGPPVPVLVNPEGVIVTVLPAGVVP